MKLGYKIMGLVLFPILASIVFQSYLLLELEKEHEFYHETGYLPETHGQIMKDLEAVLAASMLSLVLVSFLLVRLVVGPVEEITKALNRLSLGDLGREIPFKDREDELGDLARAFNRTLVSVKIALAKKGKAA